MPTQLDDPDWSSPPLRPSRSGSGCEIALPIWYRMSVTSSIFRTAADPELAAADVQDLARPVLGFAGNFLATKVDFDLLDGLARARPDWTLLLVGPARPSTGRRLAELGQAVERSLGWSEALPASSRGTWPLSMSA